MLNFQSNFRVNEEEKKLNESIRKLKARKDAEAKQRALESKEKKNKLLELRAEKKEKDRKISKERMTNKSLLTQIHREDIIQTGRKQCDSDDYGFESTACDR